MKDKPKSLTEMRKRSNRRKYASVPWDEVKALYCAGHSAADICEEYSEHGLKEQAIRKRCHSEQWPTPHNLRKKAAELIQAAKQAELGDVDTSVVEQHDDPVKALAQRVATQQLEHQSSVLDITQQQINKAKESERTLIRSAHDFELMDRVARRTMGLDQVDETANLAININGFANPPQPKPASARVVEEDND